MAPVKPKPTPSEKLGLSDLSFYDSAYTGPRPTHELPSGGTWSLYAATEIHCAPRYVYDALIDVQKWSEWNTYIRNVRITKHPTSHARALKMEAGVHMEFTAHVTETETMNYKAVCRYRENLKTKDDGHRSHETQNNTTRIRWTMDNANTLMPGFVLKTERVNEIIETDDPNVTRYRTWQAFGGMQAKSYRKKYEQALQEKYQDFCRDLKARAEDLSAKDQGQ